MRPARAQRISTCTSARAHHGVRDSRCPDALLVNVPGAKMNAITDGCA
ncbi:MAG TPA: hypothetical protein VIQ60_05870 [Gemmatimonadaceae bacterium]